MYLTAVKNQMNNAQNDNLAEAQLESLGPPEYGKMGALPSKTRSTEAYAAGGPQTSEVLIFYSAF